MRSLVLIKLGGSLITDKTRPLHANKELINALGQEIARIKSKNDRDLIVGTGAGSFGHYLVKANDMAKTGALAGKEEAVKQIHSAVQELNGMLVKVIKAAGINVYQMDGESVEANPGLVYKPLKERKIVSVYGDIVAKNESYEVLSTEELFERIIKEIKNDYENIEIIFATSVDGVLNKDDKVIDIISRKNIDNLAWHTTKGFDITGGMKQKVEYALKFADHAQVHIINGRSDGNIEKCLAGIPVGTLITT